MQTVLDADHHSSLVARFRQLRPDLDRAWGTMTAGQMVCHLGDQLKVALGQMEGTDRGNVLSRTLGKWFVLYVPIPPPKGKIQTVPEMLTSKPTKWPEDTAAVESLLSRFAEGAKCYPHPVFGPLSRQQWGILIAKHLDHHLRQFGV